MGSKGHKHGHSMLPASDKYNISSVKTTTVLLMPIFVAFLLIVELLYRPVQQVSAGVSYFVGVVGPAWSQGAPLFLNEEISFSQRC